MSEYVYRVDQELPSMALEWKDRVGAVIDFSTGWTASVKVALLSLPNATLLTGVSVTLAAVSPNYAVIWSTGNLGALETAYVALHGALPVDGDLFVVHAYARRTADNLDRVFRPGNPPTFRLKPAAT